MTILIVLKRLGAAKLPTNLSSNFGVNFWTKNAMNLIQVIVHSSQNN